MANKEKPINADIDEEIFELFEEQRKTRRQVKKGAVESAILLWMSFDSSLQAEIMEKAKTPQQAQEIAARVLRDQATLAFLGSLNERGQQVLLEIASEARKKIAQKNPSKE